jgi:hypothetical protein
MHLGCCSPTTMKKAGVMMALLALFMLVSAPWASAS